MTAITRASITARCGPGCPTCADLRRAAVALAGRAGLAGVTSERLAQFAGLPRGTLGVHVCGDVEACLAAAYRETIAGMQSRYAARLRAAATLDAGLRDATADLLAYAARHPDVASFVTVEIPRGGGELAVLRERLHRQTIRNLREELGRFEGAAAPEPQVELLIETMRQTIAHRVTTGETANLLDTLDAVLATAGEPLVAGG